MNEAPHPRVAAPGKRAAIALAVAVHVVLAVFLFYGVHWQTKVADVVEVDLVRAVPTPAPAAVEPTPEPLKPEPPKPEPPKPEPVKPVPPKPLAPPPKPDIAIKEKEKPKPPPKEEPKPKFDPFQEQLKQEMAHVDRLRAEADANRKAEESAKAAQAAARNKAMADYGDRIRAKIRGNIVLPGDLKGNPVALFEVTQLPSGEVIAAKLVKPSGHTGYDAAVERAILKSSPLPKPNDPSLFQRSLKLTFCPQEDGNECR